MRHRIGLVYLPGALPCFETFGNLPTDIVSADGLITGRQASEVLDMLIIPGGSLVESQTVQGGLVQEILKMADAGKFVLGICSGFQILSRGTDIGRLSATPIFRKGLGLIDAEFQPLICTDQVKATVVGASYLTGQVRAEVAGFHCHTYGNITLHKNANPILVSHTKRLNYRKNVQDLVSGISNSKGNVVGVIMHSLLEQNPLIIAGVSKSLGITDEELLEIRAANAELQKRVKSEIGIFTDLYAGKTMQTVKSPRALMVTALGSGSGKTFVVTGLAGALKKRGFNVGIVKVGGDIRDVVPALYLIKEPIRRYSSIKIGESGWTPQSEAVQEASKYYDFLIIEGAMSAFTGVLMENVKRPSSTAEVAAALGVPTVLVVGCEKEGIEGAMVSSLGYVNLMRSLGVKVTGVILNKARLSYLTDEIRQVMNHAFASAGVELLGIVPRINLEGRGAIPEVEIKYEEFGAKAMELAESSMELEKIASLAAPTKEKPLDYREFIEKFKNILETNLGFSPYKGRDQKACS
ncbi:MAG: AAA family ATPase [Candidatus Bathyarchaeota archaeon]|nr:AAA family ATPase [Candidatus Bathyarchaeota archaeon]